MRSEHVVTRSGECRWHRGPVSNESSVDEQGAGDYVRCRGKGSICNGKSQAFSKRRAPNLVGLAGDTVFSALETMAEHNIGAVVVLDGDDLRGILTERDYARKVKLTGAWLQ